MCLGKLPCPTCRELTTLPPTGVSGLRNDFKVQKMEDLFRSMYVRQQQQQQQHENNHRGSVCAPCQAQKKTVEVILSYLLYAVAQDRNYRRDILGVTTPRYKIKITENPG